MKAAFPERNIILDGTKDLAHSSFETDMLLLHVTILHFKREQNAVIW